MNNGVLNNILLAPKKAGLSDREYSSISQLLDDKQYEKQFKEFAYGLQGVNRILIDSFDLNFLKNLREYSTTENDIVSLLICGSATQPDEIVAFENATPLGAKQHYTLEIVPGITCYDFICSNLRSFCSSFHRALSATASNEDGGYEIVADIDETGRLTPYCRICEKRVTLRNYIYMLQMISDFFGSDENLLSFNPLIEPITIIDDEDERFMENRVHIREEWARILAEIENNG